MAIDGVFYVHIYVSDLSRTKRFYSEMLGWKLHTDLPNVAGFYFGTAYLVAVLEPRPATERLYAGGMNVTVKVDDLDAQHAQLSERGVAVGEIRSHPWGQRDFAFTDPDGYMWEYGQPAA